MLTASNIRDIKILFIPYYILQYANLIKLDLSSVINACETRNAEVLSKVDIEKIIYLNKLVYGILQSVDPPMFTINDSTFTINDTKNIISELSNNSKLDSNITYDIIENNKYIVVACNPGFSNFLINNKSMDIVLSFTKDILDILISRFNISEVRKLPLYMVYIKERLKTYDTSK